MASTGQRLRRASHSTKAASAAGMMVAIVLAGALLVHNLEGWGIVDSLYWSVLTC